MPCSNPRWFAAAVLTVLMLPGMGAIAQEHQLTLDRERAVGTRFQVQVQGEQTQTQSQTFNGQPIANETRTVSGKMTAVAEVLAQHANKEVSSIALTVQAFEGEAGGEPVTIDTTRRIIGTAANGETAFAYEGGDALPAEAAEVLGVLARFMIEADAQGISDDDMFKLGQPRAKGATWACDNKLIADDISSSGELQVDPEDIESRFHFIDIAPFAGQDAAVFDVLVTIKGYTIPGAAEQGLDVKSAEGEMRMSGLMPLDTASANGAMQVQLEMGFEGEVKIDQGTVGVAFELKAEADAEFREIEAAE